MSNNDQSTEVLIHFNGKVTAIENKDAISFKHFLDVILNEGNDELFEIDYSFIDGIDEDNQHDLENDEVFEVKKEELDYFVNEEDRIKCTQCTQTFSNKASYWNHICKDIDNNTTFTCMLCNKKFNKNDELISHKKAVHVDETYSCYPCKKAFSEHLDFVLHKSSHSSQTIYKCEECHMSFNKRFFYKLHIKVHYDKKFQCNICGKYHTSEYSLREHEKIHYDNLLTSKICPECGKQTQSDSELNDHMNTHTGVKPFQCLYCGKGFRTNNNRTVHTRIHRNEKPYECKICNKKFRHSSGLSKHKTSHYRNKKSFACSYGDKKYRNKQDMARRM